jgi:hypothetical protein
VAPGSTIGAMRRGVRYVPILSYKPGRRKMQHALLATVTRNSDLSRPWGLDGGSLLLPGPGRWSLGFRTYPTVGAAPQVAWGGYSQYNASKAKHTSTSNFALHGPRQNLARDTTLRTSLEGEDGLGRWGCVAAMPYQVDRPQATACCPSPSAQNPGDVLGKRRLR